MTQDIDTIKSNNLYSEISLLINEARKQVATQVNTALLYTYWNIGKLIIEDEQAHQHRAEYGKQPLKELSKRLTADYGKGFSRANLQWMRLLYVNYPKCQTLSSKLSWSHYCDEEVRRMIEIQDEEDS